MATTKGTAMAAGAEGRQIPPYDRAFFDEHHEASLRAARAFLGHLFGVWRPRSVLDVGCGSGAWLRACAELGVTADLSGLDGDWVDPMWFNGAPIDFRPTLLDRPFDAGAAFDLVISVETIEHLPPERGAGFVADLCRAAAAAVLFSGAVPGQGGLHHVNERWPSHWVNVFDREGFGCHDVLRPRFWHDRAIPWWYRQNALLFVRRGREEAVRPDLLGAGAAPPVDVVHPDAFAEAVFRG